MDGNSPIDLYSVILKVEIKNKDIRIIIEVHATSQTTRTTPSFAYEMMDWKQNELKYFEIFMEKNETSFSPSDQHRCTAAPLFQDKRLSVTT